MTVPRAASKLLPDNRSTETEGQTVDLIFMLTRDDKTVPDCMEVLDAIASLDVRHIGFKDVGLPVSELQGLADAIRAAGGRSYLEVVSLDEDSELASARAAVGHTRSTRATA